VPWGSVKFPGTPDRSFSGARPFVCIPGAGIASSQTLPHVANTEFLCSWITRSYCSPVLTGVSGWGECKPRIAIMGQSAADLMLPTIQSSGARSQSSRTDQWELGAGPCRVGSLLGVVVGEQLVLTESPCGHSRQAEACEDSESPCVGHIYQCSSAKASPPVRPTVSKMGCIPP
jgi:hypothetical protein